MTSPLQRLYRTKLALLATVLTSLGAGLLVLGQWDASWLAHLPVSDVGSALFTTGLIAIAFEYIDQRDAEVRATVRLRKVLREEAPAFRDAVVDGFAFASQQLTNVASPQTLDRIVENCLSIQLGNQQLAHDVYADLRHQVAQADELRRDMRVSVSLATDEKSTQDDRMFVATIRWDYRVRPASSLLRFDCVSDLEEYGALLREPTTSSSWYFEPVAGLDASSPAAFKVVQCSVDGVPVSVRRSKRARGQTYLAELPTGPIGDGGEVLLSYTFQVLIQKHSHLLYIDFGKPAKGVQVEFWYADCGVRYVNVLDFIAGPQAARVQRSPSSVPTPSVTVGYDGWVFPRSGVGFVWVLDDELATSSQATHP